ncbi:MAG: hypothetical protein ACRYG8_15290 [Janthinobacterium lividum]
MRNYLPTLRLASDAPEPILKAKFGGLPWGVPPQRWPACRECGHLMSCLAQIPVRGHLDHAGPLAGRPDLAGKVLHVFTCERLTICDFWDPRSGANAAFFWDEGELQPKGAASAGPIVSVLPEVWIEGWTPHDDPVPEEAADSFTDDARFYALPEEWQFPHDFDAALQTKLGGVPYWTGQGPSSPPQLPFRFMLEVDRWLTLPDITEGEVELANFCSDGTGFVFVDPNRADLPALFLINR